MSFPLKGLIIAFAGVLLFGGGRVNATDDTPDRNTSATPDLDRPEWMAPVLKSMETELLARYGNSQSERARRGLQQVADFWRPEDGDARVFEEFVRTQYAGDSTTLNMMFSRFEYLMEQLKG
ncbi:MAG: hypothetical protein OEM41_05890, partial [Ignavibacteria bacterium]|nr:hypothetical protein [Ignavibacteria bacterium]